MKVILMCCGLLASSLVYADNTPNCNYDTINWCTQESACRIQSIGKPANRVRVTSKDGSKSAVCLEDDEVTNTVNGYIVFFEGGGHAYIEADKKHQTTPTHADFAKLMRMDTDDE